MLLPQIRNECCSFSYRENADYNEDDDNDHKQTTMTPTLQFRGEKKTVTVDAVSAFVFQIKEMSDVLK